MPIWFNGKCSTDLGILVEHRPVRQIAQRRLDRIPVPGASRDIIQYQEDAWENVPQPYDIAIVPALRHSRDLPLYARQVMEWLHAPTDYVKLSDSYDPGMFRMATYTATGEKIENMLAKFGRATITFDCDGRWFFDSGEEWWSTAVSGSAEAQDLEIRNQTPYTAKPLIRVAGSGDIGFRLYNTTAKLDVTVMCAMGRWNQTVTLDMDKAADATYANGTNANGIVTITPTNSSTFAKLPVIPAAGVTVLQVLRSAEESVTVSIKPRWYTV